MIKEEQRGEYLLLPVDGAFELSGPRGARSYAHVFVRDAPRNRLELWQACRVVPGDPLDDFLIEGGCEYLRKMVYDQDAHGPTTPVEIWLRIS